VRREHPLLLLLVVLLNLAISKNKNLSWTLLFVYMSFILSMSWAYGDLWLMYSSMRMTDSFGQPIRFKTLK